jgi:Uma2 family endonuclease
MNLKYQTEYISEQQYLEDEKIREIKHEYINGEIYAMSGTSKTHNIITGNVWAALIRHLDGTRCIPFSSDIKVKIETKGNNCFFYPDVVVACEDENSHDYYTEKPLIIVEVLSKSTRRFDQTGKFEFYKTIPSLQEYVLIEQDFAEIEVCRRNNHWVSDRYFLGDDIIFASIGLTISVEAIYKRVKNEDVLEFLQAKQLDTAK